MVTEIGMMQPQAEGGRQPPGRSWERLGKSLKDPLSNSGPPRRLYYAVLSHRICGVIANSTKG